MGPPLFRGGRLFCRLKRVEDALLQWGRLSSEAEGGGSNVDRIEVVRLQWGRLSSEAEGSRVGAWSPRSCKLQWGRLSSEAEGFKKGPVNEPIFLLQWGRLSSEAEGSCTGTTLNTSLDRFNGAASLQRRKVGIDAVTGLIERLASMGPPLFRGGRWYFSTSFSWLRWALQWGRLSSEAEGSEPSEMSAVCL